MIKIIKKNILLTAIALILLCIGVTNAVSAYRVATVVNTRHEIWYVWGTNSKTTYTWRTLEYYNGFTYYTSRTRLDSGMDPGYLYTYHYKTY